MIEFEDIYQVLPKPTLSWTCEDVISWLQLNGLNSLISKFRVLKIDGKRFADFTQEKIRQQLKVNSRLYLLRLVEWVQGRRLEYDEYVQINANLTPNVKESGQMDETQPMKSDFKASENKENLKVHTEPVVRMFTEDNIRSFKQEVKENKQLFKTKLTPLLKITLSNKQQYFFNESAKIGRVVQNQIIINEDSVSRFHAEINRKGNDFYLKDKSKYGTFVENPKRIELYQKRYLIIGSSQIEVAKLTVNRVTFDIQLVFPDLKESFYVFSNRTSVMIGENLEGLLDPHLKKNHARIIFEAGKVWLESLEGPTYRRLEQEENYRLEIVNCIKIGGAILRAELLQKCDKCERMYESLKESVCLSCCSKAK